MVVCILTSYVAQLRCFCSKQEKNLTDDFAKEKAALKAQIEKLEISLAKMNNLAQEVICYSSHYSADRKYMYHRY